MLPEPATLAAGWSDAWDDKLTAAMAHVTPAGMLAEQHRKMAEPGTAEPAGD